MKISTFLILNPNRINTSQIAALTKIATLMRLRSSFVLQIKISLKISLASQTVSESKTYQVYLKILSLGLK